MAAELGEIVKAMPDVAFGSYPFYRGGQGVTVVARAVDAARLADAAAALRAMLEARCPGALVETPPGGIEPEQAG